MAILHVRGVPDALYSRIQAKAQSERRSISGEVILLLERAMATPQSEQDPAAAEFLRRKEALQRQAEEWYQARNAPISQEARADAWTQIDAQRKALQEKYGVLPDSTPLLRADRERHEQRW